MIRGAAVLLLIAGLLVPQAGRAEETTDGVAIRNVIERQLSAFRRNDGPGAFAFAAPAIKRKFATPDNFMQMVRRHYGPVYRPQEVVFQDLRQSPRGPVQEVLFVGPDGQAVLAYYFMEQQPDGSWRVAGVQLVLAPDLTT
jgi:hypothetical protein